MSFKEELLTKTQEIEELLKRYLPEETGFQKTVLEAMNYSVTAGGKRLRPTSCFGYNKEASVFIGICDFVNIHSKYLLFQSSTALFFASSLAE